MITVKLCNTRILKYIKLLKHSLRYNGSHPCWDVLLTAESRIAALTSAPESLFKGHLRHTASALKVFGVWQAGSSDGGKSGVFSPTGTTANSLLPVLKTVLTGMAEQHEAMKEIVAALQDSDKGKKRVSCLLACPASGKESYRALDLQG